MLASPTHCTSPFGFLLKSGAGSDAGSGGAEGAAAPPAASVGYCLNAMVIKIYIIKIFIQIGIHPH